jgi:hypothetical protein
MEPNPIPMELNTWAAAFTHTCRKDMEGQPFYDAVMGPKDVIAVDYSITC